MERIRITIPGNPITKKNHMQIFRNRKTGKPFVTQAERYKVYERDCGWFLGGIDKISSPVNLKCVYYMQTRRKVDLTNLNSSICDILVHHSVLEDDHCGIVVAMDGSRVKYDKENPRVEIEIEEIEV